MSRRRRSRARRAALGLGLAAALGAAAVGADDVPAPPLPPPTTPLALDPLAALTRHLAAAPPTARLQFAAIALDELARRYADELEAAAHDPRDARDPAGAQRWRAAARHSIAEAHALAASLTTARDVAIFVDPGPTLRFVFHGRTVMVDAPRLSGPRTLNEHIAERYCRMAHCPEVFAPGDDLPAGDQPWSSWSFGGNQPARLETSSGLDFRFSDLEHMGERKRAALELVAALEHSARLLGWYRQRGVFVEWPALHIAALPGSGSSVLVVNTAGEYLPFAARSWALPRSPIAAWYRARLDGRRFRYVFENAETIFDAP
ncbi:MAG: hypothetical protein H6977_09225 [Gammaproteobacteria bacterium]|nr:hypothetical protein [Gammaproteobacteria bacterium]